MWKKLFLLGLVLLASCLTYFVLQPAQADLVQERQGAAVVLQALWSVVAVIVAILLPQIQIDAREKAEFRRKVTLLEHIAKSTIGILDEAANAAVNDQTALAYLARYDPLRCQAAREVLDAFPIVALQSVSQAEALVELRAQIGRAVEQLAQSHTAMAPLDRGSALAAWKTGLTQIVPMRDRARIALNHLEQAVVKA